MAGKPEPAEQERPVSEVVGDDHTYPFVTELDVFGQPEDVGQAASRKAAIQWDPRYWQRVP